jgi:hypothetical protein
MLTEERLKHIAESELCEAHDEGTPCGVCDGILAARELLASRWTRITPENLPKVGDQIGTWMQYRFDGVPHWTTLTVLQFMLVWEFAEYDRRGWTHLRPINAPREEQRPPRGGEDG